jgi:hypothetical protein
LALISVVPDSSSHRQYEQRRIAQALSFCGNPNVSLVETLPAIAARKSSYLVIWLRPSGTSEHHVAERSDDSSILEPISGIQIIKPESE